MSSLDLAALLNLPELSASLEQVNDGIKRAANSDNPYLNKPITRLLQVRGKRLRPALVIAAARVQGAQVDERVIASAVAVELVHLATLVHDDLIDHAATRWNIPTINHQEGVPAALVVGDFLLARACEQAAVVNAEAARLVAATIAALCDGQARELADRHNLERSTDSYLQAVRGKTASLFAAACQMGGLCAGASQKGLAALSNFGENFGMGFQLLDDALDFIAQPARTGKPIGADVAEGVYTMPVLLALASSDGPKVQSLLRQASPPAKLTELLVQNGSIEQTLHKAQAYIQAASQTLLMLQAFPSAYLQWSLQHYADMSLSRAPTTEK